MREREQGRQPLRLAADKPPSRAGERTAVFVDKLTKMRRLSQSCCRHSSDNRTASRAVETALSSPQSQHVRRCVPRGLTARLASPLPTHLLRICAGALKRHGQCAVSKFAGGQSPTSSRQGVWICGALRLPHDLIRLPLLFPQNSSCDFYGSPESQESACSPLEKAPIMWNFQIKEALARFRRGGSWDRAHKKDFAKQKICGKSVREARRKTRSTLRRGAKGVPKLRQILLPSRHRSELRMPRHLPEEEANIR